MTALNDYERLECPGVWRAGEDDQRKDVLVSLGDATLVIYDSANRAQAHWSLAALVRRNPGKTPALYGPGADALEELEVAEEEMIGAIEKIRSAIEKRRPRQGRLRLALLAMGLAAVIGLGVYWVPSALVQHAAAVVPGAKRADIGARLLSHIERLSGMPCHTRPGNAALTLLHARLFGEAPGRIVVLSSGALISGHLPGDVILVSRTLVEDHDTPDVVAGFVLAEALRASKSDAIHDLLSATGPLVSARLLTTGDIPETVLADYAETLMTRRPARLDEEELLGAFRRARVASTPYAYARDISGETTLGLIEADPGGGAQQVLQDGHWIGLQGICGA